MVILYIILISASFYIGSVASKYIYLFICRIEGYKEELLFKEKRKVLEYLLVPFLGILNSTNGKKSKSFNIKKNKKALTLLISELLGSFSSLFFLIFSISIVQSSSLLPDKLLIIIFNLMILISFLFLAIYDLITYSIPATFTRNLLFIVVGINLIVGVVRLISTHTTARIIFETVHLGYLDNLLIGLIAGAFIWLIVKLTKEKGMGTGDIDLFMILGLVLGFPLTFISFLVTVVSASIVGVIYAIALKNFKGVIVPLVPFILIGYLITINFGDTIVKFLIS